MSEKPKLNGVKDSPVDSARANYEFLGFVFVYIAIILAVIALYDFIKVNDVNTFYRIIFTMLWFLFFGICGSLLLIHASLLRITRNIKTRSHIKGYLIMLILIMIMVIITFSAFE
jgi:hypothetical protein